MKFIEIIDELKQNYYNDSTVRKNGTVLLGLGSIPNCRHMIFKGLKKEYVEEYILSEYLTRFPKEYIKLLEYANGMNLMRVKIICSNGNSFAYNMFTVYGLPLTPPFGRPFDMEEPFDLRIEDLARHKDIPSHWLKCGRYIKDGDIKNDIDIFIDTNSEKVYSCYKNENHIVDSWISLDECLCSIYNSLLRTKLEYLIP